MYHTAWNRENSSIKDDRITPAALNLDRSSPRGAGAGGTRPLVCPPVMTECIIYEKSRTRSVHVYIYGAIQVDKTGKGWGESGPAGPRGGGSAGKEFHQFLKRSLAGERMGRARLPKTARAPTFNRREAPLSLPLPSLLFRISTRPFPPVVKSYFTLQGLEAFLVLRVSSLPPPPLPSPPPSSRKKLDGNQIFVDAIRAALHIQYWSVVKSVILFMDDQYCASSHDFQGKFVGEGRETYDKLSNFEHNRFPFKMGKMSNGAYAGHAAWNVPQPMRWIFMRFSYWLNLIYSARRDNRVGR